MSFVIKEFLVTVLIVSLCLSVAIMIVYSISDHRAPSIESSK
jgi:hypothetical protein